MTFKLLTEETGDRLGVFEERVPPSAGTPLHIDRGSDEVVHVMEGELTIRLGIERSAAGPGRGLHSLAVSSTVSGIPAGMPARAAFLFAPGQGAKFFEALRMFALPIPRIDQGTLAALSIRPPLRRRRGNRGHPTWNWSTSPPGETAQPSTGAPESHRPGDDPSGS